MGQGDGIKLMKPLYDSAYYEKLNRPGLFGNNAFRERQRLQTIERLCMPGPADDVLELGCGSGHYTRWLAGRVRKVAGVDFSPAAIEKARSMGAPDNVQYAVADICSLTLFDDHSFDKIIAIDVLEHLSDDHLAGALSEAARLLRTHGTFVFFTPCRSHWIERLKHGNRLLRQTTGHVGVRTEEEYRRLVERHGLQTTDVIRYETCIPLLRVIEGKIKDLPSAGDFFVSRLGIAVSHRPLTKGAGPSPGA
ncbi:MAG TPA: class I SAM-dependent methyltransferase [Syntrophales bacterium]|mgnify:FL=1|nr:class I SAM-dependent methyltransferase [Syntrophales bacterium]HPI56388.1 class I SAM-dependent methyltransferase [Syntrophales bacterium]